MHIAQLTINPYIASRLGLKEGRMENLGSVVALVGENGCGKTRLLETLDWLLRRTQHIGYDQLLKLREAGLKQAARFIALSEDDTDNYTLSGASSDRDAFKALLSPLESFELASETSEDVDLALLAYCSLSDVLRSSFTANQKHFMRLTVGVPRGDNLTDPLLAGTPLAYIDDICVRQAAVLAEEETLGYYSAHGMVESDYTRLQKLISDIAGMNLCISDGNANIDGQDVLKTTFSDGQMALLRIAVLIHSRALKNSAVPILLDEPERHLHPSRLIGVIEALRTHLPRTQLWIATHNLSLTAHLAAIEPRSIWFGSNGKFERAGLVQEKVVTGLLGGEGGAEQISDFCVRADQFAACAFSADCLRPPETVTYKKDDPQIHQIREFIAGRSAQRLTIVDIGAGQGRLVDGLAYSLEGKLAESVSYYAIEPNDATRTECAQRVSQHFNDGVVRIFSSAQEFLASVAVKADVAVMANVLHEIEIEDWESVLRDAHDLLQDNGSLLVVEDTRLPRGELANTNGFLVLEAEALCELFATNRDSDLVRHINAPRGGARLQATAFKKSALAAVTRSSIESALQLQRNISSNCIRNLRKSRQKPSYRLGHEHAYHAHLLANLTLALDDLKQVAVAIPVPTIDAMA